MGEYLLDFRVDCSLAKQYGKRTENECRMFTLCLYFLVTDKNVFLLLTVAADY